MEKTILVVFGRDWSESVAEFACYLACTSNTRLTGIFLEEPEYSEVPGIRFAGGLPYVKPVVAADIPGYKEGREKTVRNIENFQRFCEKKVTVAMVRRLSSDELHRLIDETRFADILVIDPAASTREMEDIPSGIVQTLLHQAHCPVMIAPKKFTVPEEVVFCYDSSPSSIFAMKQFTYILPEFDQVKATVVKVNLHNQEPPAEAGALTAWLCRHFAYTEIVALEGNMEEELDIFVTRKKSPLLVMGAYGRNAASRLLRRSHADYMMEVMDCPIFITHY